MLTTRWRFGALTLFLLLLALPDPVAAIPAFARRYKLSCATCHNPIPKLTAFGEGFAANGFRLSTGEDPADTVDVGDPLLALQRTLPLAVRLDAYAQAYANGKAAFDFQSPTIIKVLSSAPLSKSISYYFYALLYEAGEVAGVEDAFVYFNDVGGAPVDLMVGQFQVSDAMYKRELRLEVEDYAVYRTRVGDVPADLTYDRGIVASADAGGFTFTGQLVNGSGIGPAQPDGRYDVDRGKNVFLHATRDVVGGLRLGAFGYYGRATANGTRDVTRMAGVNGTFEAGPVELNAQYVHRRDDRPTFTPGEPQARINGGFAELIVRPAGSLWYGYGLYNLVKANRAVMDVGLGAPGPVRRYESLAGGVGHLIRRNLRVSTEVGYDFEQDLTRVSAGLVMAF